MRPPTPATRTWTRYVAIGDSFTEGMSDADPAVATTAIIGWADRLAEHLGERAEPTGLTSATPTSPCAGGCWPTSSAPSSTTPSTLEPDLVSIVGGGNDILRPKVDLDDLAADLEAAVARIRATGADVLMATPVDPYRRRRCARCAAGSRSTSRASGASPSDRAASSSTSGPCRFMRDWQVWSDDRIHLRPEGHRRIALAAAWSLGLETDEQDWRTPLDPPPTLAVPRGRRRQRPVGARVRRPVGAAPTHRPQLGRPPPGQAPRRDPVRLRPNPATSSRLPAISQTAAAMSCTGGDALPRVLRNMSRTP